MSELLLFLLGLACLWLHWQVRRWRRAYLEAFEAVREALEAAPPTRPGPAARQKSEPHVRAAKTRAKKRLQQLREHRRQLEAEVRARELGW
jgi:hypothetical protein